MMFNAHWEMLQKLAADMDVEDFKRAIKAAIAVDKKMLSARRAQHIFEERIHFRGVRDVVKKASR